MCFQLLEKLKKMLSKNKRGQMSEGLSWIVATIVIIVLLAISIYATTALAKSKSINYGNSFLGKYSRTQDLIMEKSLFAYFLIKDSSVKSNVYDELEKMSKDGKFYSDFDSTFKKLKLIREENG